MALGRWFSRSDLRQRCCFFTVWLADPIKCFALVARRSVLVGLAFDRPSAPRRGDFGFRATDASRRFDKGSAEAKRTETATVPRYAV